MADAVEWMESPKRGRKIRRLFLVGSVLILLVYVASWSWMPVALGGNIMVLALIASSWIAALSETPTRAAVDGLTLRVRYMLGERRIPLGDVVAVDLAPGPARDTSTIRLARRWDRTIGVTLETPAADGLASCLERAGFFVNRTPPPVPRHTPAA